MAQTYDLYSTALGFSATSGKPGYDGLSFASNVIPFDKAMRKNAQVASQYLQSQQPASYGNGADAKGPVTSADMAATMAPTHEAKHYQPGPQMPFSPSITPSNR